MASIDVSHDHLVVQLHGLDRFLAFKMSLSVPFDHVDRVRAYPVEGDFDASVKDPSLGVGFFLGGKMAVGSVAVEDGLAFYDIHHKDGPTLAIDLHHERYRHIVVELDDESPETAQRRVVEAVNRYRSLLAHKAGEDPTPKLLSL